MFIERLTLKNFKSFGGSHELPFAPGFTAIVGPNGSGKSNILDGLRWVLGESGAARLRITRQSDLIFQGSAGLAEASETEVSLELSDGGTRGSLRRHLDLSGGTLYVNGAKTRIQDLGAFKQQWHMEGDRSAFIGQGEVGAAILQKPFQRRLQLEELFGIDLYRKKRDDALEELKEAREDLLRLHTLVSELRARKDEIAPELDKARRAAEFEARLEDSQGRLYHCRRFEEEARQKTLLAKKERVEEQLERSRRWAALWKKALDLFRSRGSEYARQRGELSRQLEELKPLVDDVLRRELELNTEKSECEFSARRVTEDQDRIQKQIEAEERARADTAQQAGLLTQEEQQLKSRVNDLEDRLCRQNEELQERRAARNELIGKEGALLEESRQLDARADLLESQSEEREQILADMRQKKDRLVTEVTEADEKLEQLEDETDQAAERLRGCAEQSQALAVRAQSLRRALASAEAELESLLNRAEAGLYPRPVQMVLSAVKLGRLKIHTIPAVESFSCDAGLAPCLEAYLGGRQYWLLTDDLAQAQQGIELLKAKSGGRATFLPLDRCRSPRAGKVPGGDDVLGWALDLVTPQAEWAPAVEHLLGDLLVVRNYAAGARLSRTARYPIVTLEGEVFSPSGTVSGGKTARSAGAITLRTQIQEKELQIQTDKKAQEAVKRSLADAEKAEEQAQRDLDRLKALSEEQKSRTEALRRSCRELNEELQGLGREDSASQDRIGECRRSAQKARSEAEALRRRIDEICVDDANERENAELNDLRTQCLLTGERLSAKRSELERSLRALSELRRNLASNSDASRRLLQKVALLSEQGDRVRDEKKRREAEKGALEKAIADLDSRNREAARRMERQILRSQRAQSLFETASRNELMTRTDIEKSADRLASLIASWEEKHPYPDGYAPGDENADRLENSCRYLERSLRELGAVNRGVLSEDQSLTERLAYLDAQLKDVQKGSDSLQELISGTDRQAGSLFGSALVKIDRRFNELFQRLFGGGEAHLRAQDNMDLWEAGVEIIARPPGKKSLFLAQLSGGEQSLTALALLFASMEVAEVPLAVLDEVDAALDEANLTRFARMVAEYSKNLQVIAMTHRRQTMEHAQVMYGVTMSEPGLSQIISVRADQWE